MAIKFSDITGGGIPFGNNAGRPANPATGKLYSNGEAQRLELYTAAGNWENIVQEVPGVSSITGTYLESTNSGVISIYGTNFVNGAIASAIGTNGVEVAATSTTYNSLVQLTATFTNLSNAQEPYDIKVTNPSNLFGIIPDALYVNAVPVWQTASGSLGTFNEQVSISVSATALDETAITYALASGSSLPSGVTLNSTTGLISGTLPNIPSNTTYSFTVTASDGLNTIPRTFSISSLAAPEVFNYVSDATQTWTAPAGVTSVVFKIWGAGGGNAGSGAGGQGGYTTGTYTVVPGRNYNVYVGNTGVGRSGGWPGGGTASSGGTGAAAGGGGGYSAIQDSTNNVYLAIAGAGGGAINAMAGGNGGGSTGVSITNQYGTNSGGTQSAGGTAGIVIDGGSSNGGFLSGGNSSNPNNAGHSPGGAGGSGYYGGAGGASGGGAVTSGPGGSGYVNTSYSSNGTTIQGYGSDVARGAAGSGGNPGKVVIVL